MRQFGLGILQSLWMLSLQSSRYTLELMVSQKGSITHITKFLEQKEQPSFLNIKGTLLGDGFQSACLIYSNHKQWFDSRLGHTTGTHICKIINSLMDWLWRNLKVRISIILLKNIPTWQRMLNSTIHLGWVGSVCPVRWLNHNQYFAFLKLVF